MAPMIVQLLGGILLTIGLMLIVYAVSQKRRSSSARLDASGSVVPVLEFKNGKGVCPNCGETSLLAGPSGGLATNVACENCRHEFNIVGMQGKAYIEESRGPLTPGRAKLYGLEELPESYFDTDAKMMSDAE